MQKTLMQGIMLPHFHYWVEFRGCHYEGPHVLRRSGTLFTLATLLPCLSTVCYQNLPVTFS